MRLLPPALAFALAVVAGGSAVHAADVSNIVMVDARPLTPTDAPADEYFGRFKLSNIGVRNLIHAFAVEGNSSLALPIQRPRIEEVDSALIDWGEKYPRDPWLVRSIMHFADILATKHDVETDAMAVNLLLQASLRYRNTKFEQLAVAKVRAMRPASGIDLGVQFIDAPTLANTVWLQVHL
jgi:hypothetical protein